MAFSTIVIEHDESADDIARVLLAQSGDRVAQGTKLINAFKNFISGFRKAKMIIATTAVKASGTYTLTSAIATDVVTINGTAFTCVSSGATGNQFNVGADDTETAANLAASINASSDLTGIVTATSALGVVTVSAAIPSKMGNAITIASSDATIVASGARLTGGTSGASTRTVYFGSST